MNDVAEKAEAIGIHTRNREGVAEQTAPPQTRPPTIPLTLRETYERYKAGKGIGRQDLFGCMVEEIEKLKARIGAVDEAAVSALDKRLSSLETVIGNALKLNYAVDDFATIKRKPGRPSNAEIAAREANDG